MSPKVIEILVKLFPNLKLFVLSSFKIIRQCNEELNNCECLKKFVDFLSTISLKELHINYSDLSQPLVQSLKNFKALQTIRVNGVKKIMNSIRMNRLTQLIEAFIELSKRDSTKFFKIKVHRIPRLEKSLVFPRNCRIVEEIHL